MKFPSLRHSLMALAMAAGMSAGSASAVTITREFTANWFDPSHSGHGFGIEVIDAPVGKTLVAYWFTHDLQGKPMWVVGSGPVEGDKALVDAYVTSGGAFTNDFAPVLFRQPLGERWSSPLPIAIVVPCAMYRMLRARPLA